jgi:glutamate dehydrogenase/leucine dehydrogenase
LHVETAAQENRAVKPELVYSVPLSDDTDATGCLIVDSTVGGVCGGGIRLASGVSKLELSHLARTMTMKGMFLNLPIGGAKAAIDVAEAPSSDDHYLRRFGRELRDLDVAFLPGKDIGTNDEMLNIVYRAMGLKPYSRGTDSAYYTARSVFIATEELSKLFGLKIDGATAVIEGFGKVGSWAAGMLARAGCRIIAASTLDGAVFDRRGIDVARLAELRRRFGDQCVKEYGAELIERQELLTLAADLLVPCGGSWSIGLANSGDVRAKLIVGGANIPITDKAREELNRRGIRCCPDFVANCGGVLGATLERCGLGRAQADGLFERAYRRKVNELFSHCVEHDLPIERIAEGVASQNLAKFRRCEFLPSSAIFTAAVRAVRQEIVPMAIRRTLGCLFVKRALAGGAGPGSVGGA